MIRALTGIGAALALVGVAHAQDQIVVKTAGKSHTAIRAELYRASEAVCNPADSLDLRDDACVAATYSEALQKLNAASRDQQTADLQTVAYSQR